MDITNGFAVTSALKTSHANVAIEIRRIREELGLTQQQFADALGVTVATVSRWENGHRTPPRNAAERIDKLKEGEK